MPSMDDIRVGDLVWHPIHGKCGIVIEVFNAGSFEAIDTDMVLRWWAHVNVSIAGRLQDAVDEARWMEASDVPF